MDITLFKTERLLLRCFTASFLEELLGTHSVAEAQRILRYSDASMNRLMERYAKRLQSYDCTTHYFQIIHLTTNEVMGECGFHKWSERHSRAELGYSLEEERFMGQGFMTEAVRFVLNYGFRNMNLERIEALVARENRASTAILRRFGFVYEGVLRRHYRTDNGLEDSVFYALLRDDFDGQ